MFGNTDPDYVASRHSISDGSPNHYSTAHCKKCHKVCHKVDCLVLSRFAEVGDFEKTAKPLGNTGLSLDFAEVSKRGNLVQILVQEYSKYLKTLVPQRVMAEGVGFEPTIRYNRIPDFESGAFDHSAILPGACRARGGILPKGTGFVKPAIPPRTFFSARRARLQREQAFQRHP